MKIEKLNGEYCPSCTDSLTRYKLRPASIVPMCREDLYNFLKNGDYEIVCKLVQMIPSPEKQA